jgi:hypothetical protein
MGLWFFGLLVLTNPETEKLDWPEVSARASSPLGWRRWEKLDVAFAVAVEIDGAADRDLDEISRTAAAKNDWCQEEQLVLRARHEIRVANPEFGNML